MKFPGNTGNIDIWRSHVRLHNPYHKEIHFDYDDDLVYMLNQGASYFFEIDLGQMKISKVSDGISQVLGINKSDFDLNKFIEIIHSEDLNMLAKKNQVAIDIINRYIEIKQLSECKIVSFLRLKNSDGRYIPIKSQSKILRVSSMGMVEKVLMVHSDVTEWNFSFTDQKISVLTKSGPSFISVDSELPLEGFSNGYDFIFTQREKDVLYKVSQGKNFRQIAEELYLSPHTINTHKRNILKKSNCSSIIKVVAQCIREGVI